MSATKKPFKKVVTEIDNKAMPTREMMINDVFKLARARAAQLSEDRDTLKSLLIFEDELIAIVKSYESK